MTACPCVVGGPGGERRHSWHTHTHCCAGKLPERQYTFLALTLFPAATDHVYRRKLRASFMSHNFTVDLRYLWQDELKSERLAIIYASFSPIP